MGQAYNSSICYLYVRLTGRDAEVVTSLYRKPLSGNTLLLDQPGHPRHTIKGIPVGQFLRVRRICSSDTAFEHEAASLYKRFLDIILSG